MIILRLFTNLLDSSFFTRLISRIVFVYGDYRLLITIIVHHLKIQGAGKIEGHINFKTLFLGIQSEPLMNIQDRETLEMKVWPLITIHNEDNKRYTSAYRK